MTEADIAAFRENLRNQGLSPEALLNHIDDLQRSIAALSGQLEEILNQEDDG